MKHKLFAITTAVALLVGGVLGASRADVAQAQCLSSGSTIYVDQSASGAGDGTSWLDAFPSLQEALYCAGPGQEVWVAEGTYKPTNGTDRTISFNMISGVEIYGGFPSGGSTMDHRDRLANETILSGEIGDLGTTADNSYHVVDGFGTDASAVMDGFTITAGRAEFRYGGGMHNVSSDPTLKNITFIANDSDVGGGMFNYLSSPTLENVKFVNNTARMGGGMLNYSANPSLDNVTFEANTAETDGGGMFNDTWSNPSFIDVAFIGNTAGESGGGMMNYHLSSPSLENVTFTGNSAGFSGGGMANDDASSPSLEKVTFTNNEAGGAGGGMFNWNNSSPTLLDVDFTGNTANIGAGMLNEDESNPSLLNVSLVGNAARLHAGGMANVLSDPTLTNVLFRGNSAPGEGGAMANRSSSPSLTNVTMVANSARFGGGMQNESGTPSLTNTILWGNTATQSGNQVSNGVSTAPIIRYSLVQGSGGSGAGWDTALGTDGGGNLDADPLFEDASAGDLHLLPGSPAVDAGDNAAPGLSGVAGDLEGNPRIVDGDGDGMAVVDIGAYEAPTPPDTQGPLVTALSATPNPVALGQTVALSARLDDSTTGGSPVASAEYSLDGGVTWAPLAGSGPFNATLAGLAVGVYDVCARGTDSLGNVGESACLMLAVYNPDAGFITGSGLINSPAGALAADPDLEGRARFGFVSRYERGATRPTGMTSFRFLTEDFSFDSTLFDWLVVNRTAGTGQFKGEGTVNDAVHSSGVPYKFTIWARDGSPDTFRIRIWWEDTSGDEHVVYDNGSAQAIVGGNIIIH